MNCSESPSMYCHRSFGSKVRVSLDFSQPAIALDAGNGFAFFVLHPATKTVPNERTTKAPTENEFKCFISIQPLLTSVQQNLTARRAALANAGDVHRRVLLQRTCILTRATPDAPARIDARLLYGFRISCRVDHLRFLDVDSFRRNGAPLFADNAIGGKRPWQTTSAVIERRTKADRLVLLSANTDNPALVPCRDLPNSAGGADFRAQHATRLAGTDTRNGRGTPKSFEPGLGQSGLKRIVRANFHALAAADAARKEIRLIDGAGRTKQAVLAALAKPGVGAHQRNCDGSGN